MRFGHFDDARRDYVIDTPRTPLPWINYLGSEDFFSLVSNTGGGYSFYRDARLRRIRRPRRTGSGQSRSLLEQHCPRLGSGGCPPFPSHAGTG